MPDQSATLEPIEFIGLDREEVVARGGDASNRRGEFSATSFPRPALVCLSAATPSGQPAPSPGPVVEHLKAGPDETEQYLGRIREEGRISKEGLQFAAETWKMIKDGCKERGAFPDVSAAEGGAVFFTWGDGQGHLEVEVREGGAVEFFFTNEADSATWDEDAACPQEIREALLSRFLEHLELFRR